MSNSSPWNFRFGFQYVQNIGPGSVAVGWTPPEQATRAQEAPGRCYSTFVSLVGSPGTGLASGLPLLACPVPLTIPALWIQSGLGIGLGIDTVESQSSTRSHGLIRHTTALGHDHTMILSHTEEDLQEDKALESSASKFA